MSSKHIVCPQCHRVNRVPEERLGEQPKCGACKAALFAGRPVALDAGSFANHVERSDIPLVVDFWAPWCGPCRMMAPVFEQAAARVEPRAQLAKVNTEEQQQLAARFGIRSIPTLIVFRGGRELDRVAGALDARSLENWIGRWT